MSAAQDIENVTSAEEQPISYMQRTRAWYQKLGHLEPYRWAHFNDVPFTPLEGPLSQARLTIITTAAPYQPDAGDQGPGAAYNAAAKFFEVYSGDTGQEHDLRIAHVGIDRQHTSMEDAGCWFPLAALRRQVEQGRVGAIAPRFYGVPTDPNQGRAVDVYAREVLNGCRQDAVDAAVLVPNCPVCHQTLSLVARHLEQNGIATVVMGCAKDIVEHCGVPRFLFSDFPLGNAAGRPHDPDSQDRTLEFALGLLEHAPGSRTTRQSPLLWGEDARWKRDYLNVDELTSQRLVEIRAETDRQKAIAKSRQTLIHGACSIP